MCCPLLLLQWYTLNDVKSGRVHLTLEWVPTATEPDRLDQVGGSASRSDEGLEGVEVGVQVSRLL